MLKAHKLPIGETVGRWQILERIGRGAVASVYRARDPSRGHDVALKVLHADPHEDETHSVDRLQREIKLAQRLDDPGVCKIFEIDTLENVIFLVMEYIAGRSLRELLEDQQRLPAARALRIVHGAAEGLAAAHELDILHRDLKPGNVMVRPDDAATILDFGYAIAPDVTRVTKKGSWVGTLAYAAPELLKNQPATCSSDTYSLGVILYECLTGEMPFIGHNYGELASAILFREVTPPSRLVSSLDPRLDATVLRALSRETEQRFAGADELAVAVAELLPDLDTDEPTVTSIQALPEESTAVNIPAPVSSESTAVDIPTPQSPMPLADQATAVNESPLREEITEPRALEPEITQPMVPTPQAAHDRLAVHKKLADLSASLMRERQAKGIIQGDNPDLDGLEKTAQEELRQGHWNDTIDCLERALASAQDTTVDHAFLLAKIQRFDGAMAEKAQPHNQEHFRGLLERARTALEHGDLAAANQTLNHAFDTLRAR